MVIQTEKERIPDLVRQARSGDGQAMEELLKAAHTHVSYAWYADAANWAKAQGMLSGSTLSPDTPCTRGQIVTFLYRAFAK